jgi:hypothetical protein
MMSVGHAGRKASAVSSAQDLFAKPTDQHYLAFNYPNELILGGVPMTLARPLAGRHTREVYAKLCQAGSSA